MSKNCYIREKKKIGEDNWIIHYLRLDDHIVKITCDLLRPNRKFWQSKILMSDWTVGDSSNANDLRETAYFLIAKIYGKKRNIERLDEFFENG